jgi:25S rRNA (uracil2634-N3)-methyltransferase
MSTKRDASYEYPTRNIDNLYCSTITYACAKSGCTSCAFKICNYDIALDSEFTRRVPNVRPECCPRANVATKSGGSAGRLCEDHHDSSARNIMGYQKGMSVLTVGDGDFTFSLAVARLVCAKGLGSVTATSYEEKTTLQKVYPDFESTLKELQVHHVDVCYKVDATRLDDTLPKSFKSTQDGRQRKYHRIIWNFPCTAKEYGQDGQNSAMEENKALVRRFVSNALPYLSQNGEILMAHKTKPPYCQWGLEFVALEGLRNNNTGTDIGEMGGGDKEEVSTKNDIEFEYKGRVVFDKCLLKPYTPRKALDRKSFPCHDACFYVFARSKMSADDYQPTIPIKDEEENSVMPVTETMIDDLRNLHLGLAETKQGERKNKRRRNK